MWSIYDTCILVTGLISSVIAVLPKKDITVKTRANSCRDRSRTHRCVDFPRRAPELPISGGGIPRSSGSSVCAAGDRFARS